MILGGDLFIFVLPPSHYHVLIIKKEHQNRNTNHISIYKFDEESFDCQDVKNILNILFHLSCDIFKLKFSIDLCLFLLLFYQISLIKVNSY